MRPLFRFKQFAMTDEHCGMRIGTDGVLLGAWTHISQSTKTIADIGTGCGIIALMLAQRAPHANMTAVEIDSGACADARCNFEASPFAARIALKECCFSELKADEHFDLLVSNPPFFTETLHANAPSRATARHAGSLSFDNLAKRCNKFLSPTGRLAVILPYSQDEETIMTAAMNRLCPVRHCVVSDRPATKPIRTLWEFSLTEEHCEQSHLTIRNTDGTFSDEYISITKEFHIFL